MFGSNILDIGIGLVFAFLCISLVCTAANELIAAAFRSRARDLERGIRNLLDGTSKYPLRWWQERQLTVALLKRVADLGCKFHLAWRQPRPADATRDPDPKSWGSQFLKHQLVNGMAKDGQAPSYVPSKVFSTVLLHLVTTDGRAAIAPTGGVPAAAAPSAAPAHSLPVLCGLASFDEIRDTINKITNQEVRQALLPLVEQASSDLSTRISAMAKFNAQVEIWSIMRWTASADGTNGARNGCSF